jgi:dolichol-phosphate mannosyltransferase
VVAPLYNDGDIVQSFIEDVLTVLKREYDNYEVVLVDDGSSDDTVQKVSQLLARHKCIRLIRLSRRFGQETAISAGLDSVIGDFTVIMLPDSDPPDLIPGMVEKSRRNVGVVCGICQHRGYEPLYLRLGARLFYWYFNHVLKIDLPRNSRDFRVYSREVVNAITGIKDRLRYHRVFSGFVGYGMESFEYDQTQRRRKPRVKSFSQAVRVAIEMIIANSTHPLRMVSLMGLGLAILSFIHMGYVALVYLLDEKVVAGWATRSLHSSLMFMFVFLILAALCEYVGRLIEEVKDRPPYFVMEERNSSVLLADEERKNVVTETVQE